MAHVLQLSYILPMTMLAADHPPVFVDGLGSRYLARDEVTGGLLEHLVFDHELVETPGFVVALGERVARLAAFRNACYARVGHVEALESGGVALVSEFTYGWRLAQILALAERERVPLQAGAVFGLIRQLLPAVALLSQHARDVVHGALGPERLLITPQGRLVISEHVLGSALDALQYGRERLWLDFRIATPPSAGLVRMGPRTDVMQIGLVALSLVLGRSLRGDEFPGGLDGLVNDAREHLLRDGSAALSRAVGDWLSRALHLDPRTSFHSTFDAQAALERVLTDHRDYLAASPGMDTVLARLGPMLPSVVPPDAPPETPADDPSPVVAAAGETTSALLPPERDELVPDEPALAPHVAETTPAVVAPVPEGPAAPLPESVVGVAPRRLVLALAAVTLIALVQTALLMVAWNRAPGSGLEGEGELVVQSRPLAARVTVDGEDRGVTPLTIRLPAGPHVLQVAVGGAEPRVIPLTILAGVQTAQYVELLNVPTTGTLEVRSDPSRARVYVDGQDRGLTPVTIRDLPPGDREVVLERGTQRVVQRVRIEPGTTAQLVVPMS